MSTLLIVEDDREQALLAAQLVRLQGFEPVLALDGATGLRLAKELNPAILLLDVMLPDANGFDICRELRGDRQTWRMPIVMLTALNDNGNRRRGFRVGANAYVTKPYGAHDLFHAISSAQAWRADLDREQMHGEIHVVLDSESSLLQDVNDFLTSLNERTGLNPDQVLQLRQAIMEMGQNAIEWGNRHQSEALVDIVYRVYRDRVVIVVKDQGVGFDRDNVPHAATADDPIAHMDVREKLGLREGGFGMLISRGMVDELRYNDVGNEVTMIKRFPPKTDAPGA
jgi:DNA-binding response OmpR family regulator